MTYLPHIAGALLGAIFLFASAAYFFNLVDAPPPPPGSAMAFFFAATAPTGFLAFVKAFELIGGVLVAIPATRRAGLLILGPIVINIIAFHVFIARDGMANPMFLLVVALPLYLAWVDRRAFQGFLRGSA